MDHPGGLGGSHTGLDRPGAGFLFAGGEIGAQAEQGIGGPDQALQAAFLNPQARQEFGAVRLGQLDQLGFHLGADAYGGSPLLLGHGGQLLAVGVAAGQVVFADVGGVDDRLGGEQPQGLEQQRLLGAEGHIAGRTAGLQLGLDPFENPIFSLGLLTGARLLLEPLAAFLHLG